MIELQVTDGKLIVSPFVDLLSDNAKQDEKDYNK